MSINRIYFKKFFKKNLILFQLFFNTSYCFKSRIIKLEKNQYSEGNYSYYHQKSYKQDLFNELIKRNMFSLKLLHVFAVKSGHSYFIP